MNDFLETKIEKTTLKGVYKIIPGKFKDNRGAYIETYNKYFLEKNKININFIQDDISISKKNVLRGLHGDFKTWKLVSCLLGKFYLIVVNNIKSSNQFRKWEKFILTENNRIQILIPPGFGNGHYALKKKIIFFYKQSTYYDFKSQFTIKWDDKNFNFKWPKGKKILSNRDK